jgi:TonB family protein
MRRFVFNLCVFLILVPLSQVSAQNSPRLQAKVEGKVIRKTGEPIGCKVVKLTQPQYPPIAKAAHATGEVKIEIKIDAQGNVISAKALSGPPLLRPTAQAAALQWVFDPVCVKENNLNEDTLISFTFTLVGEDNPAGKNKSEPSDPAERHLEKGRELSTLGQFESAIGEFKSAISIRPNYAWAYYELGTAQQEARQTAQAQNSCLKAMELRQAELKAEGDGEQDMLYENSLMCLGTAAAVLSKYDEAIKYFRKVSELEKPRLDVWVWLGTVLYHKGDYQEAEKALKAGLALKPNDAVTHFTIAEVYSAQNRWKEAIASYKQYIELEDGPFAPASHLGLGIAFLRLGDKKSALNEYQNLKRINNHERAEQLLREINQTK